MDKKTLAALKDSISHWEEMVAENDYTKIGRPYCALCDLFHPLSKKELTSHKGCKGCPVSEEVGESYCKGTPYYDADTYKTREMGERELAFLKSLLPEA